MFATLTLTRVFLKIFSRDRQAIVFSLFFPILMMLAFSFFSNANEDPITIGIVDRADSPLSRDFIASTRDNPVFDVRIRSSESGAREGVNQGELALALLIPESFRGDVQNAELTVLVDASQARQLQTLMPMLEQGLVEVERELLEVEPLFTLRVEDVESRSQSYLDFVVPGLLALTLMQLSMGGSGFNLVEFRRKGILKRLFVTPVRPQHFISSLVLSRLLICLVQLSLLLAFAVFMLDILFVGSLFTLYVFIILGTSIFLSLGFCLGSLAKTQQAIMSLNMLVTWPQIVLSGIFFPIDSMPGIVQPLADLLPLSFIVHGLRAVAIDGLPLLELLPAVAGSLVWLALTLVLAVRLFNWKEVAT